MDSYPSVKRLVPRIKEAAGFSSTVTEVSGFHLYEPTEACDGG